MTANRHIFLNIVATYVSPEGVARVAKRALCGVRSVYGAVLGLFTARWVLMSLDRSIMDCLASLAGWLADDWIAAKNGKIHGKGMNAAWQRLRRLGRATGAWMRSAADNSITATISVVPDPLKA